MCQLLNTFKEKKILFFFKEFQPMASVPDNSSLSPDQDTNNFLV